MGFGDAQRWIHTWVLTEDTSRPVIKHALDLGINFFDTANVYSLGASEEILGRALRDMAQRDEVVIATKLHGTMREGPNGGGLGRKAILSEIERSLTRLQTDYVDLYIIHRWDYDTPIEETMEALHDVVKAGKARYLGASAMWAWQFGKALHVAERHGWTGDIQVFTPTAAFLYDCAGFLQSWLQDLAAEQQDLRGVVPFVVPNVLGATPPAAAWSDAAVIVPWVLYQRYGDVGILRDQWASMQAWVDLIAAATGERRLWDRGFQFGDWLDPNAPPDKPADARTAPSIVATAYFARSAELLGQAAQVLERTDDAQRYGVLANEVRTAFAQEYITPNGRMVSDATTAYALAIAFALLPTAEQRRAAGARLAALVRDNRYRISTGFVGTPLLCDALCSVGENTTAFRLLTERDNPSWLYPVTMGATTIWERWDSMLPDGGINPGEMTSFNHYALGAVADWLHRTVGGLTPAAPGYRHLRIKPCPGGGLTYARARHRTPYGLAECAWKIESEEVTVALVVPPNTTASVTLPGANGQSIEAGTHRWSVPYQNAGVVRPSLSLDSTLAEIIDDREAWATVRATIAQHLPELVQQIDAGDGIGGNTSLTLRQLLAMRLHTNGSQANLEAVLVDPSH